MGSKGGGGNTQAGSSNTMTNPNSQTQAWIGQIMNAAQNAGAGPSPLVTNGVGTNTQTAKAGQLGTAALSGDSGAVTSLMNPYISDVINANNAGWGNTNAQTKSLVDANATGMGAFGGSRGAIAEGAALSQNNIAQQQQNAGLLSQGYTGAMNQAETLAANGMNANNSNINLGMAGVGNNSQWLMQMMKAGLSGLPTGTETTQTTHGSSGGFGYSSGNNGSNGGGGVGGLAGTALGWLFGGGGGGGGCPNGESWAC